MKKFFTLTMLLVLAMTVNAQETYRKSWDFTKWSATTVDNLKTESAKGPTEGAWSDVEKATSTEPTETSKDNCFWEVTAQGNATTPATLMANGAEIEELKGLGYTNTAARSLAIAVNYQQATAGELWTYHGASYLWLGSKTKNYFVIPHVAPGTTIKMGVESHKLSEGRGVELYIGIGNSGTKLNAPDGSAVAVPTEYVDQEWLVPAEGLTDTPNEDGTFDVTIRNTNGCHLYYITVGDGDTPVVEDAKKVAYIHNGGLDEDFAYVMLGGDQRFDVTAIDVATAPTYTSLTEAGYDVAVIAPSVTAEGAAAVKGLIAYFPVVNLNAGLYSAWRYGDALATESTVLTPADNIYANAIFEGIESYEYAGGITAVKLGAYFENDDILAKAGDHVAIHVHNPGRNAYYYVPSANMSEMVYMTLIPNTVLAAAKTKAAVKAAGTPVISFAQGDGVSTVTIASANSKDIYYTTDGSDPKASETIYNGPFEVTAACTVKAYATGADGYLDSEVGEKDITIATQAAVPTIAIAQEAGKSTVTLSTTVEGGKIYFNFNGATTVALSQEYTAPVELTEPATIYALVAAEGSLNSELVSSEVAIEGFNRTNELAHFDANQTDWLVDNSENGGTGSASAYYYWGKNANSWEEAKTITPNNANGWVLKSEGQVLTGELTLAPGEGVGNGATGRYAEEAIDFIETPTKGVITFGGKMANTEEATYSYSGRIESTDKFQAPFDVVVIAGNGNSSPVDSKPVIEIQVSADGSTWDKVAELNMAQTRRYIKRTRVSYEGTDEVYVRLAQTGGGSSGQVYDIYVRNASSEDPTGISELATEKLAGAANGIIYNIAGQQVTKAYKGLVIINGRKYMNK